MDIDDHENDVCEGVSEEKSTGRRSSRKRKQLKNFEGKLVEKVNEEFLVLEGIHGGDSMVSEEDVRRLQLVAQDYYTKVDCITQGNITNRMLRNLTGPARTKLEQYYRQQEKEYSCYNLLMYWKAESYTSTFLTFNKCRNILANEGIILNDIYIYRNYVHY